MRLFRNGILVLAALSLCVTAAAADSWHGKGHGRGKKKGKHYVSYYRARPVCAEPVYIQPAPVYVRPAPVVYRACAPRYVTYYPEHIAVVRPAPYVRIGAQFGTVSISALFGGNRHYDYGCNFCDAHFSSYGGYEHHVESCGYRPANVRIECRPWDDDGYAQWNGRNPSSCRRSRDRYYEEDDRYYDGGGRYDDRDYDDEDYYDGR